MVQDGGLHFKRERRRVIDAATGWLRVLVAEDQVTELRALGVRRPGRGTHTEAGFFDFGHLPLMAELAVDLSAYAKGVYFTMNPLRPDILARRANRVDWAGDGELAKDADVIARRWLLIDADPVRDPLISSTDAEKAEALKTVQGIRADLDARGWPRPVLGDSGNGYHQLYRIDLPAEDGGVVERILKALARKYDTGAVHIDQKVFNPARICKLPGTLARKGDSIPARPHRRSMFLEVPS
jgi:hypothetical protein